MIKNWTKSQRKWKAKYAIRIEMLLTYWRMNSTSRQLWQVTEVDELTFLDLRVNLWIKNRTYKGVYDDNDSASLLNWHYDEFDGKIENFHARRRNEWSCYFEIRLTATEKETDLWICFIKIIWIFWHRFGSFRCSVIGTLSIPHVWNDVFAQISWNIKHEDYNRLEFTFDRVWIALLQSRDSDKMLWKGILSPGSYQY